MYLGTYNLIKCLLAASLLLVSTFALCKLLFLNNYYNMLYNSFLNYFSVIKLFRNMLYNTSRHISQRTNETRCYL